MVGQEIITIFAGFGCSIFRGVTTNSSGKVGRTLPVSIRVLVAPRREIVEVLANDPRVAPGVSRKIGCLKDMHR